MEPNQSFMRTLAISQNQSNNNSALAEYGWAAEDWELTGQGQLPNELELETPDEALHRLELSSFRDYGINE